LNGSRKSAHCGNNAIGARRPPATDSPWRDQQADLAHLARTPFTEEEREAILGRNAERLLDGAAP
jgi:hypothetical protein